MSDPSINDIQDKFKEIQNAICEFLIKRSNQKYKEDLWNYEKGKGGGITRVWDVDNDDQDIVIESGGVNFSGIEGDNLPEAALSHLAKSLKIENVTPTSRNFFATGVSLVIHPKNPFVPTIHMNIRYFETQNTWWFGGGIDLTPYYPVFDQVKSFHLKLKEICDRHNMPYNDFKVKCDDYFYLKHRKETRGVGGIFFDHLQQPSKQKVFEFVCDVGKSFIDIFDPFLDNNSMNYTERNRDFQLLRRSRYVEYNLLWDRGTKFGIQSEGRTESILMSMPPIAKWKYNWNLEEDSLEKKIIKNYLRPQDWISMSESDLNM